MAKRYLFLFVLVIFVFPIFHAKAEESIKEIDITTSPHKVFFEITNGRPGDTFSKVVTVKNNGSREFKYLFSNRFLTGSEKFYNELFLKVEDKNGELFNGKLKDFEKLNSRNLKSNASDELTLSVSIPLEIGNTYQGLNTEFQFKFYVEGTLGGVLPADGPKLPETGTNMFNFMVSGAVLLIIGAILQLFIYRRKKLSSRN